MAIALVLHLLFAVIWVGGMFFAWICLRPATSTLDAPTRLKLWADALGKFFPWVLFAVIVMLFSGFYMIHALGGMRHVSPYVHMMLGLGIVMMLMFLHVFFAPFKKLKRGVAASDFELAAKSLNQIRLLVGINLLLGVIVLVAGAMSSLYPLA